MAYIFPEELFPRVSQADNASDSYKIEVKDSAISTTTDANYKRTRPRTTKMIRTWTFSFTALSDEKREKLIDFFFQVGTFQAFQWTNWIDNKVYSVRFAEAITLQEQYPVGWYCTLKFEEV